jgi:hypothetical protein
LLVWGGDPVFLSYWMRRSGLADVLPSLRSETVYLGVSAGSIAATATFAETYREPRRGNGDALSTEDIVFTTPDGELARILVTARASDWLTLRSSPTWTTRITKTRPSPSSGPRGFRRRPTRSTTRPPSRRPTATSRWSPRGTGGCSAPSATSLREPAGDLAARPVGERPARAAVAMLGPSAPPAPTIGREPVRRTSLPAHASVMRHARRRRRSRSVLDGGIDERLQLATEVEGA